MIRSFSEQAAERAEEPSFILTPLVRTFQADTETPVSVYLKLQRPYSCLLESVEGEELLARFSYIAVDPVAVLKGTVGGEVSLDVRDERFRPLTSIVEEERDLRRIVDRCMAMFTSVEIPRRKNGSQQMTT
ncbi:MAG: anthranilate synthase component I, partial [Chlorobaculum sp.]|nr:anthranilate synthase component I [Chlorobaculum sp.]